MKAATSSEQKIDRRYLDWARAYNEDVLRVEHYNSPRSGTKVRPPVNSEDEESKHG